ncbi:MAG: hypothetical protein ABI290_02130, partial [Ginsengibacter sp.]
TGIWIRYFYNYNPASEVKKVKVPVLALYCSKDVQVPAKSNMKPMKEALEKGKSKDYTIMELEGLNHFFQEANTGSMNEYPTIEQTFSPKALIEISDWINKRF